MLQEDILEQIRFINEIHIVPPVLQLLEIMH